MRTRYHAAVPPLVCIFELGDLMSDVRMFRCVCSFKSYVGIVYFRSLKLNCVRPGVARR